MVETIKMSSKGQIVIPIGIREEINADEGTVFAIVSGKDSVILKKLVTPSKEELIKDLREIAKEGRKRFERKGIKEEDISKMVERARKK